MSLPFSLLIAAFDRAIQFDPKFDSARVSTAAIVMANKMLIEFNTFSNQQRINVIFNWG